MSESVAFDDVARALAEAGSTVLAAEAHGYLCGALCVRRDYGLAEWLDEILPDGSTADHGRFESLREASGATLAGTEMEFQPLLPDDEQPLAVRVEALGAWCQGFLYGFGAAGTANRSGLPEDVSEFLADLARISQVGDVGSEDRGSRGGGLRGAGRVRARGRTARLRRTRRASRRPARHAHRPLTGP